MDEVERKIRLRLRDDFPHYAKNCLKIRLESGEILPFILNYPQLHIHEIVEKQRRETGKVRVIIVKGRQEGCTTYVQGRFYWRVTHKSGMRAFILTHDKEATNNLFEMAKRYHEHFPEVLRHTLGASNAKELVFDRLESGYKLGTAGNKGVGRSSTIQLLHGSEVAFWPNAIEHAKGILQAVPNEDGTEIFFESTAKGIGNYFHEQWQRAVSGDSEFIPIFIPWYWMEKYKKSVSSNFSPTDEEKDLMRLYGVNESQIMWRRYKIVELSVGGLDGSKAFMQEYPFTPIEAFINSGEDSFISPKIVEIARKAKVEPIGSLIIGVDPAGEGRDRTAIIRRRTRCAYNLQVFRKKSPTEIANILHRIIVEESPALIVIDGAGAGGGAEIRDRLWQLGHKKIVKSVLASNVPLNQKLYFNKRAEMWGEMCQAIKDVPFQIPDSNELADDLCGIKEKMTDAHQKIQLESKIDLLKRGFRSPDCAEALALTFALPDMALNASREVEYNDLSKKVMSNFHNLGRLKKAAYR